MAIRRLASAMHHLSALSTTHLLSYPSNYQCPTTDPWTIWSIPFVTMTVSFYNPPSLAFQQLPNTHRRDNSMSRLFAILMTMFTCVPMSHASDCYPHMTSHVPATACKVWLMGPLVHSISYRSTLCHPHPNIPSSNYRHPHISLSSNDWLYSKSSLVHSASRPSDRPQSTLQQPSHTAPGPSDHNNGYHFVLHKFYSWIHC